MKWNVEHVAVTALRFISVDHNTGMCIVTMLHVYTSFTAVISRLTRIDENYAIETESMRLID